MGARLSAAGVTEPAARRGPACRLRPPCPPEWGPASRRPAWQSLQPVAGRPCRLRPPCPRAASLWPDAACWRPGAVGAIGVHDGKAPVLAESATGDADTRRRLTALVLGDVDEADDARHRLLVEA